MAVFRPKALKGVRQGALYAYLWDGERVRDVFHVKKLDSNEKHCQLTINLLLTANSIWIIMKKFALLALAICGLSACVSESYTVSGIKYNTPEEALTHIRKTYNSLLTSSAPGNLRISGELLIVMPSLEKIKFIEKTYPANPNSNISDGAATVFAGQLDAYNRYMYESIKNRKVFDNVVFKYSSDPKSDDFTGYEYKLYRHFVAGNKSFLYVESSKDNKSQIWVVGPDSPNQLSDSLANFVCTEINTDC